MLLNLLVLTDKINTQIFYMNFKNHKAKEEFNAF